MSSDRSAAAKDARARAQVALQHGDTALALRHYEYAQRLARGDAEITLAIGAACLSRQDPAAADAFARVVSHGDVQEAWLGLAAIHHATNRHDLAHEALRVLLTRHGHVRGTANIKLHDAVAQAMGEVGWCALSADGRLRVTLFSPAADPHRVVILLDGVPVGIRPRRSSQDGGRLRAVYQLVDAWRHASHISVSLNARALLGSPLEASLIGQVEGFVSALGGGLAGWAWFPRDPDSAPALTVRDANGGTLRINASDPAPDVVHSQPLARPRRLYIPASDLRRLGTPLAVQDASGQNLYGSPLDPLADRRSAAGVAELARRLFPASACPAETAVDLRLPGVPADIVGARPVARRAARATGVDVVVPVYRGCEQTLACIHSVLASLPVGARCIVVDDASPDAGLIAALQALAETGRIVLQRQARNRGFPATANAGIRAADERDVILLNSDTVVPPGWIERLSAAVYSGSAIGTATPFSNDATIFSYPREDGHNPLPDDQDIVHLDRLAQRANGANVVDVPTAHGFCVYLRRDCLHEVGLLREDLFAQGYGEENDFSIRARHLGWRHVAVPGVFVKHVGAGSFGGARGHLLARNLALLNRLHPGYDALITRFRADDPLARARFRMDALRWRRQGSRKGAVVLLSHAREGGVKRHVDERCAVIAASRLRPIVISPGVGGRARLADASGEVFPNLTFDTAGGLDALAAFLREDRPVRLELHHFIGHDPALLGLGHALEVPYDITVHDYAWVCPRITLVSTDRRYCGEPGGDACEACYADLGGDIDEDIYPSRLRLRSRSVFAGARRIVVASQDVARRMRRYFPGIDCTVTPWETDAPAPPQASRGVRQLRLRVAVVGAIGVDKGYEYLLACARHVASHRLALEFVVVGHTCDDRRLLDTGVVQITGEYAEAEAVALIRSQHAELGFLPALWPETWSYTLSQMWQAGLDVVAFDLGAPAERIRQTQRGSLLPFGLPPAATCRALLAYRGGGEGARAEPAERTPVEAMA